jgi:serine/threonine protein kinase/Tfp pilus assembly protein PilF
MGRVFKVYDTKIQEKIALKIIRSEIAGDAGTIARFRNELKLARQITHRNVCRMYDMGEDGAIHFITMELVAGANLRNMIRMTGPLTIETAVEYARQIAEGLAEAHRLGVIHRDLKPHNIMIDESGMVKIMDFGIARSVGAEGATGDGRLMGTPEYMAPEQAEGLPSDARTDIYAFGLILYEMVTGKRPFSGDTPVRLALKHKTETPTPPLAWNAALPAELNALILKCLEKDKARRPQGASELLTALDAIRARTPHPLVGSSQPLSGFPDQVRSSQYLRATVLVPAVLLLAVLAYLLFRSSPSGAVSGPVPSSSPPATVMKNSIAVLPFDVVSVDPNLAVLWRGLADDIRTRLKSLGDLNIISGYSSEQFMAAAGKATNQAANILHVEKYLEGKVLIEKTTIRVNVQLVDAQTGLVIWAMPYEEKLGESLSPVRDKIASNIAAYLNRQFNPVKIQKLKKQETENNEAKILVYRAQELQRSYRDSRLVKQFQDAAGMYQKAADLDPNYLQAYLGLGNLYEARYVQTKDKKDLAFMVAWFQRASAKDEANSDVEAGLGWGCFHQEDFDGAYSHFKKALSLDPNNAEAYFSAGSFLRSVGLCAQANKCNTRAIDLDPLNYPYYLTSSSCSWVTGDYESALRLIQIAKDLKPDSPRVHLNYARFLIMMKDLDAAEREMTFLEHLTPMTPEVQTGIRRRRALLLAVKGDRAGALALLKSDEAPYSLEATSAYSLLGLKDTAILNIKKGHDQGFHLTQDYLYAYPFLINNRDFDGLRDDPRFQDIVAQEKALYEAKIRKYGDLGETPGGGDSR